MVKLTSPFGSATAQGSIGKKLTYYRRGKRQKVRQFSQPTDPKTPNQQTQRGYFQEAAGKWQDLTNDQRQLWRDFIA